MAHREAALAARLDSLDTGASTLRLELASAPMSMNMAHGMMKGLEAVAENASYFA